MITTERQKAYQLWLGIPESQRPSDLRTHAQIAERLNVSLKTLNEWEAQPGFWEVPFGHARAILGQRLPPILSALAKKAESGNIPAIKLSLEVLGVHQDHVTQTVDIVQRQPLIVLTSTMDELRAATATGDRPTPLTLESGAGAGARRELPAGVAPTLIDSADTADTADTADSDVDADMYKEVDQLFGNLVIAKMHDPSKYITVRPTPPPPPVEDVGSDDL